MALNGITESSIQFGSAQGLWMYRAVTCNSLEFWPSCNPSSKERAVEAFSGRMNDHRLEFTVIFLYSNLLYGCTVAALS